jgi:hypothetical protein
VIVEPQPARPSDDRQADPAVARVEREPRPWARADRVVDALRLGLPRPADADPAVAVGVERRLDVHGLLDRVRERELRLSDAALELEPGRRCLRACSGGQDKRGERRSGGERVTS